MVDRKQITFGDHITDEIEALKMSVGEVAGEMGISKMVLNGLIGGIFKLDDLLAEKLSKVIGASKEFWKKLYKICSCNNSDNE